MTDSEPTGHIALLAVALLAVFLAGWYANDIFTDPMSHCGSASGQLAERCGAYRAARVELEYFVADAALGSY